MTQTVVLIVNLSYEKSDCQDNSAMSISRSSGMSVHGGKSMY